MGYMRSVQRNFTLPTGLSKAWTHFQGEGSKESSRNAAGALFLFMLMPVHIRDIARQAAYEKDPEKARNSFQEKVKKYRQEMVLAEVLIDAALAVEGEPHEK